MAWADLADLTLKVSRDVLGEAITWRPAAGGEYAITAPFDDQAERAEFDGETWVTVTQPMASVRVADLPAAPKVGDKLTVRSVSYEVRLVEVGGHGDADLWLVERA